MLLLRLVKAKAQNQGKAKARVPPSLILQAKAKRAKKARRVKKVQTPKATRAKKDRRVHTPGPSWKVARVQQKGTQNNRFSPSIHQLPPVSLFPPSTPLTHSFHLCPSVSPPFTSFSHPPPAGSFASLRQQDSVGHSGPLGPLLLLVDLPWLPSLASPLLFASTQSVIPAHSVYCVFSFSLSCLCAAWAQSVIPAHSVPCCFCTCFHFSFLCFSTTA